LSSVQLIDNSSYYLVGNEEYCENCLKKKFKVAAGDNNINFSKAKKNLKNQLFDTLGKEKVEASFMKLSSYMETVAKLSNLYGHEVNQQNANEFYCMDELQATLTKCGRNSRFRDALEEMDICKGQECYSLSNYDLMNKFN